jgi:hypothetical protein
MKECHMQRITPFPAAAVSAAGNVLPPYWDRYARLPALIEPGQAQAGNSFQRLADRLRSFGSQVTVSVTMVGAAGTERWLVKVGPKQATAAEGAADRPDVEVITTPSVWAEIASGTLSPVVAFGTGRMRIRGDLTLATRLLRHVATTPTAIVDICSEGADRGRH